MSAKEVKFSQEARDRMIRGIDVLANAVRVTLKRVAIAASAAPSLPATAPTSSKRSGNWAITSHA